MDEDDVMVVVLAVRMMIIMAILMMTGSFTGNHILFQSTAGYPSAKTKHLQNCVSPHRRARINQDCWPELRIGMFSLFRGIHYRFMSICIVIKFCERAQHAEDSELRINVAF